MNNYITLRCFRDNYKQVIQHADFNLNINFELTVTVGWDSLYRF